MEKNPKYVAIFTDVAGICKDVRSIVVTYASTKRHTHTYTKTQTDTHTYTHQMMMMMGEAKKETAVEAATTAGQQR